VHPLSLLEFVQGTVEDAFKAGFVAKRAI